MASLSSIAKLPKPDLTDPPNGPGAFQNLTSALDLIVIPRFNSSAARDAAIPAPSGGQHAWLSDSNTLTVYSTSAAGWITYPMKSTAGVWQSEDTTSQTFTSTTAVTGSPVVGLVFTAPPSGMVALTVAGNIQSDSNGASAVLSYEVRTGNAIGSGTQILSPAFYRGIRSSSAVITGASAFMGGANRRVLTGLTPGADYNVRTMHWVSSTGTGKADYRQITVEPVF